MSTDVTPKATRRQARFSKKRALIIRSAAQAFGRKGFHATTLDEIAADLNVTKASLYYYFATKEDLLYEVHLLSMQEVTEVLEKIRERGGPAPDQLRRAVREHLRIMATHYEGAFLLQQEYDLAPSRRDEIRRLRDNYETIFRRYPRGGGTTKAFPGQRRSRCRASDSRCHQLASEVVPFGRTTDGQRDRRRLHRFLFLRVTRALCPESAAR